MKRLIISLMVLLMLAGVAYAGAVYDNTITVSTTAQGFSASVPESARKALATISGCDAYFSLRTAPTAYTGHKLYNGDSLLLDNYHDIKAFSVIITNACSATATTLYYTIFDR